MPFREIEERVKQLFSLSAEELHRRGIEALLTQELKYSEEQLYSFLKLSAIQDAFDKNPSENKGTIEAPQEIERFSRVNLLKQQIREIKALLKQLKYNSD